MNALRLPAYRWPLVRLWLLWALLVGLHFAWRVWVVFGLIPADPDVPDVRLIDFGFTHLPYWLAAIMAALVLQFVLFRRWWDDALTQKAEHLSDLG